MRNFKAFLAVWGLLIGTLGGVPAVLAQEPAVPDEQPAAAEPPAEEGTKGIPFGLYVGVSYGQGDSDSFDTSISANSPDITSGSGNQAVSSFELSDATYGRAALGWKLPDGKGSFRIVFQGVREEEYEFRSEGRSSQFPSGFADTTVPVPYWFVTVSGGRLESIRMQPEWIDAEAEGEPGFGVTEFGPCMEIGGGMLQCGEIFYDMNAVGPNDRVTATMPEDMQNRVNTYDVLYGREFGGRRFSSRWWGGLRYFTYDGQMLAGAWLNTNVIGQGYTNGDFLRLLQIRQESTGVGPTGSWEVDFNFFDRALQFFIRGEAAFTRSKLALDSGPFFYVDDQNTTRSNRLLKALNKSSWQDKIEIGSRLYFKNGLEIEFAWSRAGYLDIVLMPNVLQLNNEAGVEVRQPQSSSQDLIVDTLHFGAGFQF